MKKNLLLIIIISIMCFTISVKADNYVAVEGNEKFNSYKTQYNKGIQKISVNGTETITLYGYINCTSSGCTYKYSNTSADYKEVLKSTVTCTGGEKNILYLTSGAKEPYINNNPDPGEAYFSEDFSITCTGTKTNDTITLNNSNGGGTSTGGTSNGGSEYSSSTTTDSKETGVETYYIVLGIIGIISYAVMKLVKKQNLFKNI